jgi:hypothetical protein
MADRTSSYSPISPSTGGNIRIVAGGMNAYSTSAAFNVNTAGTLTFEPTGTTFDPAVTFPTAGSTTTVGNLIVGSSDLTSNLIVGAAVISASEVTYRGGSITVNANVRSDNGSVAFLSTVASKAYTTTNSPTITAAQGVTISRDRKSVV